MQVQFETISPKVKINSITLQTQDNQRLQTHAHYDAPLMSLRIFIVIMQVWRHGILWCHIWPCPAMVKNPLKFLSPDSDHLMPATGRPCFPAYLVSGTVPAFTCDCPCSVCAFSRWRYFDLCVCLRLREQCLRLKITSVARVAHVLLLRSIAGNMDVKTLASKHSELIGNAAIVWKRSIIHKKSTCVCLRLPVAAIYAETQERKVDLWPALEDRTTPSCVRKSNEIWVTHMDRQTDPNALPSHSSGRDGKNVSKQQCYWPS